MSRFIESLECRTLLSASASTLSADFGTIITDASSVKTSFLSLEAALIGDYTAVLRDLKGSKGNSSLLRTLKSDGLKALGKLKADGIGLLKAASTAKRGAADGTALLKKSSTALTAKVQKDITALGSVTTTPLTKLQNDSQNTGIGGAVDALTAANPSNTALTTDAAKLKSDASTRGTAYVSAAQTFATAVAALKTDLQTLV